MECISLPIESQPKSIDISGIHSFFFHLFSIKSMGNSSSFFFLSFQTSWFVLTEAVNYRIYIWCRMFHWKHMLVEIAASVLPMRSQYEYIDSKINPVHIKASEKKSRILSANYSSVWHWQCYCHSANKGFAFQFIVNRSKNYDEIPRCQYHLLLPHWTVWQSCQWELFDIYWKTFWSHFFPLPNRILVPEILPCIFYAFFPEIEIILPS